MLLGWLVKPLLKIAFEGLWCAYSLKLSVVQIASDLALHNNLASKYIDDGPYYGDV